MILNLLRCYKPPSKYPGLGGEYRIKVFRYSMCFCNPGGKKSISLIKNLK